MPRFASPSPCCNLTQHRAKQRRSDGGEERRIHGVLVFCREVQQREHARVEERPGGERQRARGALQRSDGGRTEGLVYLTASLEC